MKIDTFILSALIITFICGCFVFAGGIGVAPSMSAFAFGILPIVLTIAALTSILLFRKKLEKNSKQYHKFLISSFGVSIVTLILYIFIYKIFVVCIPPPLNGSSCVCLPWNSGPETESMIHDSGFIKKAMAEDGSDWVQTQIQKQNGGRDLLITEIVLFTLYAFCMASVASFVFLITFRKSTANQIQLNPAPNPTPEKVPVFSIFQIVSDLITMNRLDLAFEEIKTNRFIVEDQVLNDKAALLEARYTGNEQDNHDGVILRDEYLKELNRIRDALLALIAEAKIHEQLSSAREKST